MLRLAKVTKRGIRYGLKEYATMEEAKARQKELAKIGIKLTIKTI